jgi:uncharacterized protein (TIGR00369 family)
MSETSDRSRTYTWEDPHTSYRAAGEMTGLEYMQALADGVIPLGPMFYTLGILDLEVVVPGKVIFTARPEEFHYNLIGSVHGGFGATMLDAACGSAIHTMLPRAMSFTTIQLNINFVRSLMPETDLVSCIGEAVHVGKRTATAQARLIDANDSLYSHATATCAVFSDGVRW